MIQIRSNVFETNSSSTHSICIPKKTNKVNQHIDFAIGEYGWENRTVTNTASYLYTAILDGFSYDDAMERIEKLTSILDSHNISYDFEKPKWMEFENGSKYLDWNSGCIDHACETREFVDAVLNDEDMLLRYLADGIIYTGNDNQDDVLDGCDIALDTYYDYGSNKEVPNPYHDEENYDYFYKGN